MAGHIAEVVHKSNLLRLSELPTEECYQVCSLLRLKIKSNLRSCMLNMPPQIQIKASSSPVAAEEGGQGPFFRDDLLGRTLQAVAHDLMISSISISCNLLGDCVVPAQFYALQVELLREDVQLNDKYSCCEDHLVGCIFKVAKASLTDKPWRPQDDLQVFHGCGPLKPGILRSARRPVVILKDKPRTAICCGLRKDSSW